MRYWLLALLVCDCGGAGGEDSLIRDACPSPAGEYKFLQHERAAFGTVLIYDNGTYHMESWEQDETGTRVIRVPSDGYWQYLEGCHVVRAWLTDPSVYFLIVMNKDRTEGAFTSMSENLNYRIPLLESGVLYKF